jgi:uncharacterized protein YkwD
VPRTFTSAIAAALAVLLLAPGGAQAREACGAEQAGASSANRAQVSDTIFCLTNQVRASYGLPPFRRDARLDAAARLHSQDMSDRGYFAHVTPEGRTPSDRAAAQGYPGGAGENIAYGYRTAAEVMVGWMASTGHCRNILGPARDFGIGTFAGGSAYFTQAFGDYAGATGSASGGCPYALNLDTLVVPETSRPGAAPATTIAAPATDDAPQATAAGPALGGLALSPARLRAGGRGRVAYKLSAAATVTFRVERALTGRRAGGRCVAAGAAGRRAARCVRYRTLPGTLSDAGARGANTFAFRARLGGRPLAPGRYRLRAVAADAAGSASAPRHAGFAVVSR